MMHVDAVLWMRFLMFLDVCGQMLEPISPRDRCQVKRNIRSIFETLF